MSTKKYKFLESSKKRIGPNKWDYRGFSVEKLTYNQWVVRNQKDFSLVVVSKEKIEQILNIKAPTAKEACIEIDKILGILSNKKKTRRIPPKKEKEVVSISEKKQMDIDDARRVAYEFREEIGNKLKTEPGFDPKLAIPVRRIEVNKKSFCLGWNQNFNFVDEIISKFEQKYSKNFEFELQRSEKTLDLTVKAK